MIEIADALSRVRAACPTLSTIQLPTIDSVGYVLDEEVVADIDSPPHDKALVDGFAIRSDDAGKTLQLLEQVVAGSVPNHVVRPGTCTQVMTGAPIPDGAEAMVMVEETSQSGNAVTIDRPTVERGEFIMPQGKVFRRAQTVLSPGTLIRPIEVGLLCEVGKSRVACRQRARVAILPTGDELVACDQTPGPGQIRNSNGPLLTARAQRAGAETIDLGVGRDEARQLKTQIEAGLDADILVLSGGVSAGVRDLVPATLATLGVQELFHKVRLKPGKPLWFGQRVTPARTTLVFGLPGNPVSSLVCFELFVLPAIRRLAGRRDDETPTIPVRLSAPFIQRGSRTTYHPATRQQRDGRTFAQPLTWFGSADMATLSQADSLLIFPAGNRAYQVNEKLEVLPLDE